MQQDLIFNFRKSICTELETSLKRQRNDIIEVEILTKTFAYNLTHTEIIITAPIPLSPLEYGNLVEYGSTPVPLN